MKHSDALGAAKPWVAADAPIIWLLGKTQAGKTSIVAELTGQAHDEVGRGYRPMTRESRIYAFPPECPALRFLDTRGLADCVDHDSAADLAQAREQAHLLLVVLRVDDLDVQKIIDVVAETRRRHKQLPVIVAQTGLHRCYGKHERHADPYPFDGSDDDRRRPRVPPALGDAMLAQRRLFSRLKGPAPVFVPLDFTRAEQGVAPADYGADLLWSRFNEVLPLVAEQLRKDPTDTTVIRAKYILPYATAAAAANAIPIPVAGGLTSASLQSAMVVHIAHRLGFTEDYKQLRGEFVGALGTGFVAGFGSSWTAQQVLKLGLGWGTAVVASWTFAVTWAIGEVALYYFTEKSAGRTPERDDLRERYQQALRDAQGRYKHKKQKSEPEQPQEVTL
jgi:uncharacterized protein (DUF697 family)